MLSYDIIGSKRDNPWFIMSSIVAEDIWDAEKKALDRYGYGGFVTVQLSSFKVQRSHKRKR